MNFIILSGGKSKRLFPLSRENSPKQFIPFFNQHSLIEDAILRARYIDRNSKIFIVCSYDQKDLFFPILKSFENIHLIYEPQPKNTLPAIFYALQFILDNEPIVCFPSDHFIGNLNKFKLCIEKACNLANLEKLVLLGIKPQRVETGYGYIEIDFQENRKQINNECKRNEKKNYEKISFVNGDILGVKKFYEKPDLNRATFFFKSKRFLWNSGIFIFDKNFIEKKLEKLDFLTYSKIKEIGKIIYNEFFINNNKKEYLKSFIYNFSSKSFDKVKGIYEEIKSEPFDKGICEKIDELVVIYSDFDWSDLGTFESILDFVKKHNIELNNSTNYNLGTIKKPKVIYKKENKLFNEKEIIDNSNNLIFGTDKFYILNEVDDLILVDCDDVLYISKKEKSHEIKNIIEMLEKEDFFKEKSFSFLNEKEKLYEIEKNSLTVRRPWGIFSLLYDKEKDFKVKRIEVYPNESLSLQYHKFREEHWIVVKGESLIEVGQKKIKVKKGSYIFIDKEEPHRIINDSNESFVIVEIQIGEKLTEEDIFRLDDKYYRN